MSFTTRCPACGTMFRVVPDQLKVSDGWVRCGHCSDVFDAMLNLLSDAKTAAARPPPAPPTQAPQGAARVVVRRAPAQAPAATAPPSAPGIAPLSTSRPAITRRAAPVESTPAPARPTAQQPQSASNRVDPGWDFVSQFEALEQEGPESVAGANDAWDGDWLLSPQIVSQHRASVDKELQHQTEQAQAARTAAAPKRDVGKAFERELANFNAAGWGESLTKGGPDKPPAKAAPGSAPQRQTVAADSDFGPQDLPTFVVQGRREAVWRSPAVRSALLLLGGLLSLLLGAQWALHERDGLAARYPAMAPALQTLCSVAGCEWAAPRRINAVVIDSSTLVRKLGQIYDFDLVLKNSEGMAVAMPSLELSLTDGRDKEIARRVFLPTDMPGKPTLVPANGSLSVNMRLALSASELSNMAGYRALVFYP